MADTMYLTIDVDEKPALRAFKNVETAAAGVGKGAAQGLSPLEAAVAKSTAATSYLSNMIGRLGVSVAGAFTVGAVVNFAREIGQFASRMTDLTAQTGIGVERLQALNYVAAGAGLTVEDISLGVEQLSR